MIESWYRDTLRPFGHRRIDEFNCLKGVYRLGAEATLRRLRVREDMWHVVRFDGCREVMDRASEVKRLIEESDTPFSAKWTSFRANDELLFVFADTADAVRFRFLWD